MCGSIFFLAVIHVVLFKVGMLILMIAKQASYLMIVATNISRIKLQDSVTKGYNENNCNVSLYGRPLLMVCCAWLHKM